MEDIIPPGANVVANLEALTNRHNVDLIELNVFYEYIFVSQIYCVLNEKKINKKKLFPFAKSYVKTIYLSIFLI